MDSSPAQYLALGVTLLALIVLVVLLIKSGTGGSADTERARGRESRATRREQAAAPRTLWEELLATGKTTSEPVVRRTGELREAQAVVHEIVPSDPRDDREAMLQSLQERQLEAINGAVEGLRHVVAQHLQEFKEGNEKKFEEMRRTVDEKLHGTLERRLGESFAVVSERLEAVQRGLGEMQSLADGVGDLKKVLTNVRARGPWGECQLQALLEQILTPDQYCANYRAQPESVEAVDFAVRLPGREEDGDPLYLPIDSKFPQESYQRLLDAADRADAAGLEEASAALVRTVRARARSISEKYVRPPYTTDFGIMFLPTEGLFAEVLRQPSLAQDIQRQYDVVIAGPTTLTALLSSLRMGFRTLAIERRSGEVWQVLGAVKTEIGEFGGALERLRKELETASNIAAATGQHAQAIERRLREVEKLPPELAKELLGLGTGDSGNGEAPGSTIEEPGQG